MSVQELKEKKKRYELVAPDGGWGYVICVAVIINLIAISSFIPCLGMMLNEIYIQLGMNSTSITLLNGISAMSVSIAGFITGPLLNCMSLRRLGVVAGIIFNLGAFGVIFVNSKILFFLSFGILQSFGNGMLINITFTVLNDYFDTKRMLSMTITQTVIAVAALFSSQFVKWSADLYGHRGTLILISAIYLQVFVAIALMQPVKWHMKKIEITEEKYIDMKPLLIHEDTIKEKTNAQNVKVSETQCVTTEPITTKDNMGSELKEKTSKMSEFQKLFKDFMDVKFLKSFLLSNASIGLAMSGFTDVTFILMLPQALYFMGWTEGQVAWAISLINFGDLVTKVIFILFNNILHKLGIHEIYIAGLILAFFSRLGMLWSDNPTVMLVFITIMGISRCMVNMFLPLVISESVPKDKFTTAMGIVMLIYGSLFLTLGPAIGAIRDLTDSYGTAFYILTSCFGIVAMFWIIELLYKRNKHKRIPKKNASV